MIGLSRTHHPLEDIFRVLNLKPKLFVQTFVGRGEWSSAVGMGTIGSGATVRPTGRDAAAERSSTTAVYTSLIIRKSKSNYSDAPAELPLGAPAVLRSSLSTIFVHFSALSPGRRTRRNVLISSL